MPKEYFNPPTLNPTSGFTHVVTTTGGKAVYVSGQVSVNEKGEVVGKGDFRAQLERTFENLKAALDVGVAGQGYDALADVARDVERVEFQLGGKQRPLRLVDLADDAWPALLRRMKQKRAQLVLDDRALFLDDDDLLQAFAEGARCGRLDRPAQADLQDADAELTGAASVGRRPPRNTSTIQSSTGEGSSSATCRGAAMWRPAMAAAARTARMLHR